MQYLAVFARLLHINPVGSDQMKCTELVALSRVADSMLKEQNA